MPSVSVTPMRATPLDGRRAGSRTDAVAARLDGDRGVGDRPIVDGEHDLRAARPDAVVGHFDDERVGVAPGRTDGEVLDRAADVDDVQRQAVGNGAGRMRRPRDR